MEREGFQKKKKKGVPALKSSRGNSPAILHAVLGQSLVRGTLMLLLQTSRLPSQAHIHLFTLQHRGGEERRRVRRVRIRWSGFS